LHEFLVGDDHERATHELEGAHGAVLTTPAFEDQMELARVELEKVSEHWKTLGTREIGERSPGSTSDLASRLNALATGVDFARIDEDLVVFDDCADTKQAMLGVAELLPRVRGVAPAMCATDERAVIEGPFRKQCSLMQASAFENPDAPFVANHDEVEVANLRSAQAVFGQVGEPGNGKASPAELSLDVHARRIRSRHVASLTP
jgi:hypothetical protein